MPNIKKLIQEKFGFTVDLPRVNPDMHEDVTERNGKGGDNPAYLPVEKFRNVIKHILGATTSREDELLENAIDFKVLERLAARYGFEKQFINNLQVIKAQLELPLGKRNREDIAKAWEEMKGSVPFWFLGLLPNGKDEMPEEDKTVVANLMELMKEFNKNSEKIGKERAEDTPHAGTDTNAKDNLKAAKKDSDYSTKKEKK